MREVVIVDSVRTGLAKSFRGKFNMTRPDDMTAHCVNALLERTGVDKALIDDCMALLAPEGLLVFSTNAQRFRLDPALGERYGVILAYQNHDELLKTANDVLASPRRSQ